MADDRPDITEEDPFMFVGELEDAKEQFACWVDYELSGAEETVAWSAYHTVEAVPCNN